MVANTRQPITISILVVSWNTRDFLQECIRALLAALDSMDGEIIVVDNASSDGTVQMVRDEFGDNPKVSLLANAHNAGFAAANNQALAAARGEIIGVVNPDIVLSRSTLMAMLDHLLSDKRIGIVSCDFVGPDGKLQNAHRSLPTMPIILFVFTRLGRWIDWNVLRQHFEKRYRLRNLVRQGVAAIEQISGACFLMRRSTIDEIGGLFDERFPILGNDVDLSRRIQNAGLKADVLFDAAVTHYGSASLEQVDYSRRQVWRNQAIRLYYELHEPFWKQLVVRIIMPTNGRT